MLNIQVIGNKLRARQYADPKMSVREMQALIKWVQETAAEMGIAYEQTFNPKSNNDFGQERKRRAV